MSTPASVSPDRHDSPRAWKFMCGLVLAVTAPPYIALSLYPPAIEYMLPEDTVYEMAQALAYLAGALIMTLTAVRAMRRVRPLGVLHGFVLLFAAALFFAALEELDYGQRLLSFRTPDCWLDLSMQSGVNLHNLHTGVSNRLMALIAITAGLVLPLLRLVWPWGPRSCSPSMRRCGHANISPTR